MVHRSGTRAGSLWAARNSAATLTALVVGITAAGCSATPASGPPTGRDAAKGSAQARPEYDAPAAALRAQYIRDVQQDAGQAYAIAAVAGRRGRWTARNPAHGLGVELDGAGVRIWPAVQGSTATGATAEASGGERADWQVGLRLAALGRSSAMRDAPAVTGRKTEPNGVRYERGAVVEEWYLNGPLGVEQGFDLARRPAADRGGALVLEVAIEGTLRAVARGGDAVALRDDAGRTRLVYRDLFVRDARGDMVPAEMAARGGRIALVIDDTDAVYPLQVDPLVWREQRKLIAADGADEDVFGFGVAISGDTAAVASLDDHDVDGDGVDEEDVGAVYVYERNSGVWAQRQKLTASDEAAESFFGSGVALSNDTLVVGASSESHDVDADGIQDDAVGAAYVFVRDDGTWTEQQKITASDGAADDRFGVSVGVSGDTVVVGARNHDHDVDGDGVDEGNPGAAYVFVRDEGTWTEQQKITASDGAGGDQFGGSVGVSGDTAVVGARLTKRDVTGDGSDELAVGAAYVFVRSDDGWTEEQRLTASDGGELDRFGGAVAVAGETVLIGAQGAEHDADGDGAEEPSVGAAYVFVRSDGSWTEQQTLTASDGARSDRFGYGVALSGDGAVVGAIWVDRDVDGDGTEEDNVGAAYVFVRSDGSWTEQQKLAAADGGSRDIFGNSVALSGDTAVVGAYRQDRDADGDGAEDILVGAAYVFIVDSDGDGFSDANDTCPFRPDGRQSDEDGDGAGDACDACPSDPSKTEPGTCGCGISDADGDGDGRPDCVDDCPDDPDKVSPGLCGCGQPDADADGDGRAQCIDDCPDDPDKSAGGQCGCGTPDTDTDGDGLADCRDECPEDADKIAAGECGCGEPEGSCPGSGGGGGGGCGCVVSVEGAGGRGGRPLAPSMALVLVVSVALWRRRR